LHASRVLSPAGTPLSTMVMAVDITDHVRSEQKLRETILERETARQHAEHVGRRLNGILASIQDDFYVLDHDWKFAYASPLFTRKLGKEPEDFLGQCIWEMFPKHLGTPYEENVRAAMEQREVRRFELRGVYTQGDYRMTAFPCAEGITLLGSDISEQKRAERALAHSKELADAQAEELEAIIEAMTEGLNIADRDGRTIRMNRAGATLLGYETPGDIIRELPALHEIWALETPDGSPVGFEQWPLSRALRGETFTDYELVFQRLDKRATRTLSHAGSAIRNAQGQIVRAIVTYRDISGLVEARRYLSDANAQLVEMDRRKNEFIAVLSHELRNPLAPIKNCLYILEQAAPGGEQARRAKQTIDRQVKQLVRLVDDLLDVTRIARGKVELQRQQLDVCELLLRTLEDHRSEFERARIRLQFNRCPDSVWVDADANRIAQAIGNVLQNAAKFTPAGGAVTVHIASDAAAGQAVIRVADSGIGMEPEVLSRLFQPFMQGDHTMDRSKGGLGLGLALVKGLIELQGGTVEAESQGSNCGTLFTMRLPLARESVSLVRLHAHKAPIPKHRVLIIEDNTDAADSLCELLELEQHEVAVAYDGPSGIVKAREWRPTVILCDIGLPGMNGYEVAKAIRAEPLLNVSNLVALSGYSLREDVKQAMDAGFDGHMAKPPSLTQLKSLLAGLPTAVARSSLDSAR